MSKPSRMSAFIPTTPAARSDVLKLGGMVLETFPAAFSTIGMRTGLLVTQSPLNPEMMKENRRMVFEKVTGFCEAGLEVQVAWLSMLSGDRTPWWTSGERILKPLHERTVANSKRLIG